MLPASFYKDQDRAKQRARVIKRTRFEEVAPGLRVVPIRVDAWLHSFRFLFPDERCEWTRYQQASLLGAFRRAYGQRYMHEITPMEAQAWTLKQPIQARYLVTAWDYAVRMYVVPLNIWKLVTMPRNTKPKPGPPSAEQLEQIIARCHEQGFPSFAHMIEVAAYTGAREGGLMALRRSHVDLAGERMTVCEKGDKTRSIVLAGRALEAMRKQFELRERHLWQVANGSARSPHVFVQSEARGIYQHRRLYGRMVQLRWAEVRGDFPFGFHSLKHFAATWLHEQGASPLDIALQLGHEDREGRPYTKVFERTYHHPKREPALERVHSAMRSKEAANG